MSPDAGKGNGAADSGDRPEDAAFERLERAVEVLVERLEAERLKAETLETKNGELARLVQRFTGNEAEAGELMTRLKGLEGENAELRGRLEAGRAGVERMIARIKFLENQG